MRVLVACEESQAVCKAFRERGHEAYSCDIIECSGGHPEWHIKDDVLRILNPSHRQLLMTGTPTGSLKEECIVKEWRGISFFTMDGVYHEFEGKWDMIIAFPPCTYLTVTGNRWFDVIRYERAAQDRWLERCKAIVFFLQLAFADCEKIVIENPIGCMNSLYRKPDQVIQPYEHGHNARKSTCLWLKNVPKLKPTEIVEPEIYSYVAANGRVKTDSRWRSQPNGEDRAKYRSKTFPDIAKAMAEQWG